MKYEHMVKATFLSRPNRFVAHCLLDGKEVVAHVKNTGRCKELLVPGADVWLQYVPSEKRSTDYDLIAVRKGERIINMDAVAPNAAFAEYVKAGHFQQEWTLVKRECTHGDSRYDLYLESAGRKAFVEIKGVTLETDGIVRFPDAPTERGIKHLHGLMRCIQEGYEAYAVFIIQMENVKYFEANRATHAAFADALAEAARAGVKVLAYDCVVQPDGMAVNQPVKVRLDS
ncbi:MAG: DNA/RNA nuclease SfsA [Clostridiales bacterium]|nr:DNA/RNA nuclease SfsA [Clostridiales bacterium]